MISSLTELRDFEEKCLNKDLINNLIIILGANIDEPHIINFAQRQLNTTIWCVSNDSREEEREVGSLILKQFNFDFNNRDEWVRISTIINRNFTLTKIIVDWSTAKFFGDEFNLYNGNIMRIIREFMDIHNTEFYSPCCYEGGIVNDDRREIMITPGFFKYFNPTINYFPKDWDINLINQIFNIQFNEFIKDYMDNKYILEYKTDDEYPLEREGDKKINRYFIIKLR